MVDLVELYKELRYEFSRWTVKVFIDWSEGRGNCLYVRLERASGVGLQYRITLVELYALRLPSEAIIHDLRDKVEEWKHSIKEKKK